MATVMARRIHQPRVPRLWSQTADAAVNSDAATATAAVRRTVVRALATTAAIPNDAVTTMLGGVVASTPAITPSTPSGMSRSPSSSERLFAISGPPRQRSRVVRR
jgi:hypothetical protein